MNRQEQRQSMQRNKIVNSARHDGGEREGEGDKEGDRMHCALLYQTDLTESNEK